jgi:hypothetical protein
MAQKLLDESEIRERAENPKYRSEIAKAIIYQDRLRRHTVAYLTRTDAISQNTAIRDHFNYVSTILESRQYSKYEGYYKFPQSTLKIADTIYGDQYRIFKPSDRVEDIRLKRPDDSTTFLEFYKDFKTWIKSDGYQIYRERTCNLVFVDMPSEGEGMPIYYEVGIKKCVDYEPLESGELNYALFDNGAGYIWVDSEKYMQFAYIEKDEADNTKEIIKGGVELGKLISTAFHYQEETPCRQFWTDNFNNLFNKETAISGKLADLDSFDFLENGKDHNDIINIYPTRWSVVESCDYNSALHNNSHKCSNGYLVDKNGGSVLDADNQRDICPGCQGGNLAKFAGVHMGVSPPNEDVSQITIPGGFINVDPKILEAITNELAIRKNEIISSSLGQRQENNAQAKNQDQVNSELESQGAKLFKVKKNFETFEEWFIKITASLMFGEENVNHVSINYGVKWHLERLEDLELNFVTSVEKGLPQTLVMNDLQRVISSRHKGDEIGEKETKEWLMLEPFVGVPYAQVRDDIKDGLISQDEWLFYRHFKELKTRFNAEFPEGILNFMPEISQSMRHKKIKDFMLGWMKEVLGGEVKEVKEELQLNKTIK